MKDGRERGLPKIKGPLISLKPQIWWSMRLLLFVGLVVISMKSPLDLDFVKSMRKGMQGKITMWGIQITSMWWVRHIQSQWIIGCKRLKKVRIQIM
jgi:hypothetical protein